MTSTPKRALGRFKAPARPLGSFIPKLTGKAFEKYGFSTAMLLTDWSTIVGRELAIYTMPERLKWPRHVDAYSDTPVTEKGRPGATLVLRVDGPRAIDVQYQSAQIMDRINAYFGYRAVTALRFVQAPVEAVAGQQVPAPKAARNASTTVETLSAGSAATPDMSNELAAALGRLEASILADSDGGHRSG